METDERLRSPPRPLRIALPCGLNFFVTQRVSRLRTRRGGFAVAPSTPSQCTPMLLELFRGRTERIRFDRKQHFPPSEAKHNNNEGKPFSFGAESAIIDMLGKNQQRGNPAVGRA